MQTCRSHSKRRAGCRIGAFPGAHAGRQACSAPRMLMHAGHRWAAGARRWGRGT